MSIIIQKKGKDHILEIRKEACNYWQLTGGRIYDWSDCLRMALEDHVAILWEQEAAIEKQLQKSLPIHSMAVSVEGEDTPSDYGN